MKSDCYKAKNSPRPDELLFVLVPHGNSFETLPDNIKQAAGGFTFDKTIEINPAEQMDCFDAGEAGKNLIDQGYHLIIMKQ